MNVEYIDRIERLDNKTFSGDKVERVFRRRNRKKLCFGGNKF